MRKVWEVKVMGSAGVIATCHIIASDRQEATAVAYKNFGILVGSIKRTPINFIDKEDFTDEKESPVRK